MTSSFCVDQGRALFEPFRFELARSLLEKASPVMVIFINYVLYEHIYS